jgi:hypothetical protein
MKYRQKALIVEAIQIDGNEDELVEFMGGEARRNIDFSVNAGATHVTIGSPSGMMSGNTGDWVIKGKKRKFYLCRNDAFKVIYEPCPVV